MLEEPAVVRIRWPQILLPEPCLVRGHPIRRVKPGAEEAVTQDGDALDREACPEWVNGLEVRSQPVEPLQLALGVVDAGIGFVAGRFGRGRWRHDLPGPGRAAGRILRDEMMQQRRSRPGQTNDEEWAGDALFGDAGMTLSVFGQP